jgi:hypothetical protein
MARCNSTGCHETPHDWNTTNGLTYTAAILSNERITMLPDTAPMNYSHLKFKGSSLQENKGCPKNLEHTYTHILNAPDLQTNEGYVPKFTS